MRPGDHTVAAMALAALALTSCAPARTRPPDPPPMAATQALPGTGIVLVVRVVTPADDGAGNQWGRQWRGLLLADLAGGDDDAAPPAGRLSEIIVRQANGALISVVQPDDPALHAGVSVAIARPTATAAAAAAAAAAAGAVTGVATGAVTVSRL